MAGKNPIRMGKVFVSVGTEKAILVEELEIEDGEPTWVPNSCVHDDSEVEHEGDRGELVVVEWFAEKRGWL